MSRSSRTVRLLRAQRQAADVLAATLLLPGASLRRKRPAPHVLEGRIGGQPATIIRPDTEPPWPTFVFANGATPDGRTHPIVQRLGVALARSGYAVYIPDLPGVSNGVLTPVTLAAALASTAEVADDERTRDGRVGLVGVSIGGTLALLVAANEQLAPRISVVSCIAPFTDLERVILLATTGVYRDAAGATRPYPVPDELAAGLARSIEELGPPDADDEIRALLSNRDAGRFEELYRALPAAMRETVIELSPRFVAGRIRAPVEIATAPRDRYFPVDESLALVSNPRVRITVTAALTHATPRLDPRTLVGLMQLDRFFVRSLLAAA